MTFDPGPPPDAFDDPAPELDATPRKRRLGRMPDWLRRKRRNERAYEKARQESNRHPGSRPEDFLRCH